MKKLERTGSWLVLALMVGVMLAGIVGTVEAQQQKDPSLLIEATREQAKAGWSWLSTVATFVVGGGALSAGGRALFKGEWGHGAIGIGLGVAVLLFMWVLGNFFGY